MFLVSVFHFASFPANSVCAFLSSAKPHSILFSNFQYQVFLQVWHFQAFRAIWYHAELSRFSRVEDLTGNNRVVYRGVTIAMYRYNRFDSVPNQCTYPQRLYPQSSVLDRKHHENSFYINPVSLLQDNILTQINKLLNCCFANLSRRNHGDRHKNKSNN